MARPTFSVPAGTKAVECDGHKRPGGTCRKSIYFTPKPGESRNHPMDCDPAVMAGLRHPTADEPGIGVSHFGTCPDAQNFARRKR